MRVSREKINSFNRILFLWHKKNFRKMQWRETRDPYLILVSEIMLQQTQVDRVREIYARFIQRFPSVSLLAQAPLSEVLILWKGLGYNRRAKYLHQTAIKVAKEYGGIFPVDRTELKKLPGIGDSTASAIRAFSHNFPEPMIDTNLRRILIRVFFKQSIPHDKYLYEFASKMIPEGRGRSWNYAMLDVGATVCKARGHQKECPFAQLHGVVSDFIYKKPQTPYKNSRRFWRGKLIDQLRLGSQTKSLLIKKLGEGVDCQSILDDLLRENLIVKKGNKYMLSP